MTVGLGLAVGCTRELPLAEQPAYCELPPASGDRLVSTAATGLPVYYRLTNQLPESITATLFADFEPGPFAAGMLAKTRQCLAEASDWITGPQGEKLNLRFASPSELDQAPVRSRISLTTEPYRRGHLFLWHTAWGCPEILHEVMHLVGLVDEYAEDGVFQCRSLGPSDSLMTNPHAAYHAVVDQRLRPSLLYPVQFQAIVYPGCRTQNSVYLQCAANAYRRPSQTGLSCEHAPPQCRSGRTDWIVY